MIRLYVDAELEADTQVSLAQAQAHYLKNVMRRAVGDEILLFNGRDGEWHTRIAALDRNSARLSIESQTRAQASARGPTLLVAPLKRAPLEWLVEKATELGVGEFGFVTTERTNAERVNVERLTTIAVEAAEQSERLTVPALHAPTPLAVALADWPVERQLYVLDESGGGSTIADALQVHPKHAPAAFLVGPAGGFAQGELDGMKKLTFVTALGLGPRILRAETAAIAALACYQALAGDW